jgi:hypothetical protein
MHTTINEWKAVNEDFYSNDTIALLAEKFNATVTVDKEQNVKPLYGGGTFTQIGYLVIPNDSHKYSKFIFEGITNNGKFLTASVIIFVGETAMVHGSVSTEGDVYANLQAKLDTFKNS